MPIELRVIISIMPTIRFLLSWHSGTIKGGGKVKLKNSRRRSFGGKVNFNCSQAILRRVMGWYCEYTTKFRLLYHTINYSQTLSSLHLSIYDAKSCQTPILVFAAQISLRIFVCVGTPSPLPIPSKHPHSLPARLV